MQNVDSGLWDLGFGDTFQSKKTLQVSTSEKRGLWLGPAPQEAQTPTRMEVLRNKCLTQVFQ